MNLSESVYKKWLVWYFGLDRVHLDPLRAILNIWICLEHFASNQGFWINSPLFGSFWNTSSQIGLFEQFRGTFCITIEALVLFGDIGIFQRHWYFSDPLRPIHTTVRSKTQTNTKCYVNRFNVIFVDLVWIQYNFEQQRCVPLIRNNCASVIKQWVFYSIDMVMK